MDNPSSPLKKYSRQPKLYIDLPSKGQWYKKDVLEKSEELEVYSMTANDEIGVKTPDALISGKAIISIIENCIPSIKDGSAVTTRDLDYLLASIRIASYGDTMNVGHICTKCSNEDSFSLPLQSILDHLQAAEPVYEVNIENFIFRLRPLLYKELVQTQVSSMRVRRQLFQLSESSASDQPEEIDRKTEIINNLYDQINEQTKSLICSVVTEVITPEGESETNPIFIKDFILNNQPEFYNKIQQVYAANNRLMALPVSDVECSECGHGDKVAPSLDYTNFFSRG